MEKISNVNSNQKRSRHKTDPKQVSLLETTQRNATETFYRDVILHSEDAAITNMHELSNTAPMTQNRN